MTFDGADSTEEAETSESSASVQATWDDSNDPSTAVIEAVAAANGRDPLKMPPLYDALDVEALDALLTSDRPETPGSVGVSFTYDGTYVWVSGDGTIEIDPNASHSG